MGRGKEIKERFQTITITNNGIEKKLSPSIINSTLTVLKDGIYVGINWHIKFKELKLDANAEQGVLEVRNEDGSKKFECQDHDTVKVQRFVDILVDKYTSWKEKRDGKNNSVYHHEKRFSTTKKRARKCYGSSSVRGKRMHGSSTLDKFDDIISSSDEEELQYDNDVNDDDNDDCNDDLAENSFDDIEETISLSSNRKSICLTEEEATLTTPTTDGGSVSVAVTDEEEIIDENLLEFSSDNHHEPVTPTSLYNATPQSKSSTNKGITNYFPSSKSISRTKFNNTLVQDSPPPTTAVPPKTPVKDLNPYFKPISTHRLTQTGSSRLGLRNMGNTCYLNSSLQMLYSLPSLLTSLDHLCHNSSSLKLLDSILQVSKGNNRDASTVKQAMDKITPKYHGFEQRDAHEFISDVVDNLHTEIENAKNAIPKNNISPIDVYFRMDLRVSLTCDTCQYRRSRDEIYRHLSLDISNVSSVTDALSNFFMQDTVCLSCENCSKGKTATRTMQIIRLPKALHLHLKRFIVTNKSFLKNKAPVHFPSTLSLRQFSSQDITLPSSTSPSLPRLVQDLDSSNNKTQPLSYSLKSVVHHIGSNANCGHYITDACSSYDNKNTLIDSKKQNGNNTHWKRFDDSVVSKLKWNDVVSDDSQKNAYMLMYELNV